MVRKVVCMMRKVLKKLGILVACLSLISVLNINAYAKETEWNTYYTGPGAAYPTDIVSLDYNIFLTHYVKAESVTGNGAKVTVSGINVNMQDIPQGKYMTYTFTATSLNTYKFRPLSKSGSIDYETYMCASSGNSTYYSSGKIGY